MAHIRLLLLPALAACLAAGGAGAAEDPPRFANYAVATVYAGDHHPAVIATGRDHEFRTMLKETSGEAVNFAGHYIVRVFGAGACAVMGFVMDAETGKVTWFPYTDIACADPHYGEPVRFDLHSRLIVFQGEPNETQPNGEYYFEFRDGQFIPVTAIALPGPYPVQKPGGLP